MQLRTTNKRCSAPEVAPAYGKWFGQCSRLLQGRFRYSSSAKPALDLQNRSFPRRRQHRPNHFSVYERCLTILKAAA